MYSKIQLRVEKKGNVWFAYALLDDVWTIMVEKSSSRKACINLAKKRLFNKFLNSL
jgi:hypothetical protein